MKGMLLLMSTMVWFVAAEVFLGDVDEPIPMLNVSAVAGFKAQIPCDINPASRSEVVSMVFWYKDERDGEPIYSLDARGKSIAQAKLWSDSYVFDERATMRTNVDPAKLEIDPLEATDAGVYRCRVDYKNSPTRNQKVNLTVIVPPNKPVIYTGPGKNLAKVLQPFNEGSELSLSCEVIGGSPPPKVTWHFEEETDDTYTLEHGDTTINHLDITNVTRKFLRARLICRASNTHLVAPLTSEIILDINLKPLVVNITNKETHLSALKTYEVECASSGSRPEAVITWWKGNHQVKHMARNFADSPNITRSVLSYVPTMEDDGKYLICRAENPVVPNSALEDKWRLLVHYAPIVTIKLGLSLKANDINEGDDVYFECDVQANPKAYKLAWYKDGKELHQNSTARIFLPSGQSLVLRSVTRNSAGEYSCMAVNVEGKSTSRPVTLDIMYAPVCKDGSSTQVVGALKHETISLVCGVQSKPPPITFHWTFNNSGELMNVPANRFTQVKPLSLITSHWHGSRLNYTPANDMDYGTVACWAKNRIGVQKTPCLFQIIVAGKPYPLQNCTALQSTGPYAYRMDRGTSDGSMDYSLLVACFAGGITAVCILIVGITLTLYRRNHPMQSMKTHTEVVRYGNKDDRVVIAPLNKETSDEIKGETINDMADDDPDVIPSKMDKRPDIFEPNYETSKSDRTKDFGHLEDLDYPTPSSVLHTKDSWIYPNGYVKKVEKSLSPLRPSTLPVHRSHDIYTRSSRVQESCI
ncbi:hemicentin-1-like isoform X3 [Bombus pyrosoma]|uniref:hemicentin-1-like isoform X3 n=1 Tax=Bombus pyrosoma TaxID=396416 RepID=UPI001CB92424|nr:hemicentin-1-like isoform X3 [Bombus pyrosoma]